MVNILFDALSGVAGALSLVVAGLPFDTVKLKMQTIDVGVQALDPAVLRSQRNPLEMTRFIVRTDGLLSLWRGAFPAFLSAGIENAVGFAINGLLRRIALQSSQASQSTAEGGARGRAGDLPLWKEFAIGAAGGVVTSFVICPPEVIKCQLQSQLGDYTRSRERIAASTTGSGRSSLPLKGKDTTLSIARGIYKNAGVQGFYRGLVPLLARDVPFNCVFFGSYRAYGQALQYVLPSHLKSEDGSPLTSLVAGGFAGMTAWAIIFPMDVLKSKMQTAPLIEMESASNGGGSMTSTAAMTGTASSSTLSSQSSSSSLSSRQLQHPGAAAASSSSYRLFLDIIQSKGGLRSLYKGASPAIMRGFVGNAALFYGQKTTEEFVRRWV